MNRRLTATDCSLHAQRSTQTERAVPAPPCRLSAYQNRPRETIPPALSSLRRDAATPAPLSSSARTDAVFR